MAFGARHLSLTADEPAHIVRGYVALTSGDFWMVPLLGHPPLIEEWAALPLVVQPERPDPSITSHWREHAALYIQALLPELGSVTQLEILTRVPIMLPHRNYIIVLGLPKRHAMMGLYTLSTCRNNIIFSSHLVSTFPFGAK